MISSRALASLVAAACLLAPLASHAANEEAHRMAAASFKQAQAAFARREFAAAAASFEQAAHFEPHPSPYLNAADAWILAGEPVRAAEDCDQALALGPAEELAAEATQRLKQLEAKIATLDLRGPRTSAVRLDGGADTSSTGKKRLSPGHHALVVVDLSSSKSKSFELDLGAGEIRAIDLGVAPWAFGAASPPVAPSSTAAPPPVARDVAGAPTAGGPPLGTWVSFGVAAVAGITGATFGVLTSSAKSDFDGGPTQSAADTFHRDKAITNVALGVAGAAAALGVVLWVTAPSGGPSGGKEVSLTVRPERGGAKAGLVLSF